MFARGPSRVTLVGRMEEKKGQHGLRLPLRYWRRALLICGLLVLLVSGIAFRRLVWQETTHLRFQRDIVNGFYWGSQTLEAGADLSPNDAPDSWQALFRGYLALYDKVEEEAFEDNYNLDYPPLRLLVMSVWTKEVKAKFPGAEDGTPEYVEPLLVVNDCAEFLTAIGIFLLVRLIVRRARGVTDSTSLQRLSNPQRATICGLVAAACAWFEPSLILDAHAWPQWDAWILPFYIFAALAALTNRWFWCGCLLALGSMFKGQLLFVAPFFIFWPLWQRRWARAGLVFAGFIATVALIVSPWLLRHPSDWAIVLVVGIVSAWWFLRRGSRYAVGWTSALAAIAAFAVAGFGDGDFAWLQVGFLYGSEHYPYLFISSCYNLPSLMAGLNFSLKEPYWTLDAGALQIAFTWQWTLRLLYLAALILCSLGAARHARRRDPRLLIAIATPWLIMFALLGQMHERYLVWGAVLSAVALGVSLRLSLLHFVFSLMSSAMITHVLLIDKKLDSTLHAIDIFNRAQPIASWVLLAAVAVYLRETLSTRAPIFQPRRKSLPVTAAAPLSLAAAPEG